MSMVTILQIALASVLAVAIAYQNYRRRGDFPSKDRFRAWVAGILLMLAGVAMLEAQRRLGYSARLLPIGVAAVCVGVGLMVWGSRGYKPKVNRDTPPSS